MLLSLVPAFWPLSDLGATEIIIILIIAVVLFGSRLPQLGRTLGKGLVSFRKGVNEMKDEISKAASEDLDKKAEVSADEAKEEAAQEDQEKAEKS